MRIEIVFSADGNLVLPFHHNLFLQAFAYSLIQDNAMKDELHNQGIAYEKRVFKPFTFSNLIGNFKLIDSQFHFQSPIEFIICTNLKELAKEYVNSIISANSFFLNKQKLEIISMKMLKEPDLSNATRFKTLSPITVYSTLENPDGSKYTRYYNPRDPDFTELVKSNIQKKATALYDMELPDEEFYMKPTSYHDKQMKTIMYKNTIIKAWAGDFELTASEQYKRIAYEVGLGGKNAQGLGCIEVLE